MVVGSVYINNQARIYNRFNQVFVHLWQGNPYVTPPEHTPGFKTDGFNKQKINAALKEIKAHGVEHNFFYAYLDTYADKDLLPTHAYMSAGAVPAYLSDAKFLAGSYPSDIDALLKQHGGCVAIVGSNFKDSVKVGQKLTLEEARPVYVAGVLAPNQYMPELVDLTQTTNNLTIYIVDDTYAYQHFEISDYSMMMTNSIFNLPESYTAADLQKALDDTGFYEVKVAPFIQTIDSRIGEEINLTRFLWKVAAVVDIALIIVWLVILVHFLKRRASSRKEAHPDTSL